MRESPLTPTLSPEGRGRRKRAKGVGALAVLLSLNACGSPTACLANRYDAAPPQTRCISGIQLPGNILKDTDPMSGSSAPVTVAR